LLAFFWERKEAFEQAMTSPLGLVRMASYWYRLNSFVQSFSFPGVAGAAGAVPVEGVYHDVFRAVGPEVVDRGIDGPHEVAGVFLRDAVELLPVQVHLPL